MTSYNKSKTTLSIICIFVFIILISIIVYSLKITHKLNLENNLYAAIEQRDYDAVCNVVNKNPQLVFKHYNTCSSCRQIMI